LIAALLAILMAPTGRFPPTFQGELINARQYGVLCNGVADDYPAFTRALAAVPSGGILFIPPSSSACLISKKLLLSSPVTIFAYPGTVVLKPMSGSTSNPLLLNIVNVNNVTVYGVTFDGGGASNGNPNNIINVGDSKNVLFNTVKVQNTRGIGMLIFSSSNTGIIYSTFSNIGMFWQTSLQAIDRHQAIAFTNATSEKNYAIGNFFTNIGLDALSFTHQTDFVAQGNRCQLALATPQYNTGMIGAGGAYPACIYSDNNTSVTIVQNVADSAPGNGIDVGTSSSNLIISDNYVTGSGGSGIAIDGVSQFSVTGNITINNLQNSSDCHQGGISFGDANLLGSVSGNVATDTQGRKTQSYGIYAYTACLHPASFTNVFVDQNNITAGNKSGAYGGNISAPTTRASSGTFTATGTGGTGGTTSGTATYSIAGQNVCVAFPAIRFTASNATTFTITGLPAAVQPATLTSQAASFNGQTLEDNGSLAGAYDARVTNGSGTLTLYKNGNPSGWTASGVKGFIAPPVMCWLLN
jgi:hypothetical protein